MKSNNVEFSISGLKTSGIPLKNFESGEEERTGRVEEQLET